jgi:hypothetical protein
MSPNGPGPESSLISASCLSVEYRRGSCRFRWRRRAGRTWVVRLLVSQTAATHPGQSRTAPEIRSRNLLRPATPGIEWCPDKPGRGDCQSCHSWRLYPPCEACQRESPTPPCSNPLSQPYFLPTFHFSLSTVNIYAIALEPSERPSSALPRIGSGLCRFPGVKASRRESLVDRGGLFRRDSFREGT